MPKRYFQMIPTIDYDVDGDGTTKVAVNILRRVKARAEAVLDGAIFYNYQMQDGDNAEIIADKYYGSSQYHWVVHLMNNALDHTYDYVLNDNNFERSIAANYGSLERASGVTINLSSVISGIQPLGVYNSSGIRADWWSEEQSQGEAGGFGANTGIDSGFWPAGNSTAIFVNMQSGSDPFQNIDQGDVVHLFVPEDWYNSSDTGFDSGFLSQDSVVVTEVYLDSDASGIDDFYVGATLTITSENPNDGQGVVSDTEQISEDLSGSVSVPFLGGSVVVSFDPAADTYDDFNSDFVFSAVRPPDVTAGIWKASFTYSNNYISNITALTDAGDTANVDYSPTWSTNNQIMFTRLRGSGFFLVVMDTDGSNETDLHNPSSGDASGPFWNPSGNVAGWSEDSTGRNQIYTADYNIVTKTLGSSTQLTSLGTNKTSSGSWSASANSILFTSDRDLIGTFEVYKMDTDGANQTRLTTSLATRGNFSPRWNSDGTQIVWYSERNGHADILGETHTEIFIMNADGSDVRLVGSQSRFSLETPFWHPTGAKLGWTLRTQSPKNVSNAELIMSTYSTPGFLGITGNTRTIATYDGDTRIATFLDGFLDIPQGGDVGVDADVWGYTITYPTPKFYPHISYTAPAKVLSKSVYQSGSETDGVWTPDSQDATRFYQLNVDLNANSFNPFDFNSDEQIVYFSTGIHHFEMDLYNDSGQVLLAENIAIGLSQFVNTSIGTADTKRIVTNLDHEDESNQNKRNIFLLKKDYLVEFVEEFEQLMKQRTS